MKLFGCIDGLLIRTSATSSTESDGEVVDMDFIWIDVC